MKLLNSSWLKYSGYIWHADIKSQKPNKIVQGLLNASILQPSCRYNVAVGYLAWQYAVKIPYRHIFKELTGKNFPTHFPSSSWVYNIPGVQRMHDMLHRLKVFLSKKCDCDNKFMTDISHTVCTTLQTRLEINISHIQGNFAFLLWFGYPIFMMLL